jgi:hypothetical protein
MTTQTTSAGTPVLHLSDDEYRAYVNRETELSLGIDAETFLQRVRDGVVDWDDPDALYVAGLLRVNGAGRA